MAMAAGGRLGPYEILDLLGAGGMGEVYRARDTRLDRTVAIKVLAAPAAGRPDRRARFQSEARAIARLSHPHICALFDVGEQEGTAYLVMEHLEGRTLADRLEEGPLPLDEALRYGIEMAEALDAAHRHGVIHRDLKPRNVMLTADGVKLLDFGLAKLREPVEGLGGATDTRTQTGSVIGTLPYMSPECLEGAEADARSDIFALGVVLYEMATGERPFAGKSQAALVAAVLSTEPAPLGALPSAAPPAFERAVARCLAKDREKRWQSARDLAVELRWIQESGVERVAASSPSAQRTRRLRTTARFSIALVLAAAAVILAFMLARRVAPGATKDPASGAGPGRGALADRKSIAVLPFQNLSPDPENAFFADGITEEILAQLSTIRDLKVIARTSVMRYKGSQKRAREIASELGVATVLEGSVRRAGRRVRIVAQLVDGRTEEHVWGESYERDLDDVFSIQSDVAQRIATALQSTLMSAERERIERRPTRSLEAYDLYLKGRTLYYRYRREDNEQAIESFRRALELDPRFALAHAGLADAYAQRAQRFGFPGSWLEASIEEGTRAVDLDPQLSEGHKALGLAYMTKGQMGLAAEADRRAIALRPNFAAAVGNLAMALYHRGQLDEALAWGKRSAEMDPSNPVVWGDFLIFAYAALGDTASADAAVERAVALQYEPFHRLSLYLHTGRLRQALAHVRDGNAEASSDPRVLYTAGFVELVTGDERRARRLFEKAFPTLRGQRRTGLIDAGIETELAYLLRRAGRQQQAEELLAESLETDRRLLAAGIDHWQVPFDMACVYALRGQKEDALRWLEKSNEAGWRGYANARWTPLLHPLRADPRFQAMMSRLDGQVAEMRRRAGV